MNDKIKEKILKEIIYIKGDIEKLRYYIKEIEKEMNEINDWLED